MLNGTGPQHSDFSFAIALFPSAAQETGNALGTPEETSWPTFTSRIKARREGPKDGPAYATTVFSLEPDGRVHRRKDKALRRTAVPLDIETSAITGEVPPDLDVIADRIQLKGWMAVIHTSHSHEPSAPRYRIILPTSHDIPPNLPAVEVMAEELGVDGVFDRSKSGPASIFYHPFSIGHPAPQDSGMGTARSLLTADPSTPTG
jgi:hypothetical protein